MESLLQSEHNQKENHQKRKFKVSLDDVNRIIQNKSEKSQLEQKIAVLEQQVSSQQLQIGHLLKTVEMLCSIVNTNTVLTNKHQEIFQSYKCSAYKKIAIKKDDYCCETFEH